MKRLTVGLLVLVCAHVSPGFADVSECDLAFLEDSSAPGQKRYKAFVFSDAETVQDRIDTARAAAEEIVERSGFDFVDVFLIPPVMPRERNSLDATVSSAWVRYAPDPAKLSVMDCVWEIKATDKAFITPADWTFRHTEFGADSRSNAASSPCSSSLRM